MAKILPRSPSSPEMVEHHLYRITFRRRSKEGVLTVKTRVYITLGTDEDDAIDRIKTSYRGSSFERDFDTEDPVAVEFIIGGLLKVGGS